jgi:hypothetical protein
VSEPNSTNGGNHVTIVGAAHKLGAQVIHALTPQFLALVLVNIVFMGLFVWYIGARADHAAVVMQRLLDECLNKPTR